MTRLDAAALLLADHRIRVLLDLPQGANASRLPVDEVVARATQWYDAIIANASQEVTAIQTGRVPEPGPALEDVLFWNMPAFELRASKGPLEMDIDNIRLLDWNGQPITPSVEAMARAEARRVVWEFLPPPPFPALDDQAKILNFKDVETIRRGISYTSVYGPVRPANDLSNYATLRHQDYAAVAFIAIAEGAHVRATTAGLASLSKHDLRGQLLAEYERMVTLNSSLLLNHALEKAWHLLSTIPEAEASTAENTPRFADALGELATIRLLRGLPVLEPSAPPTTASPKAAAGFAAWVAVAAVAGAAAGGFWIRKKRL